MSLHEIELPRGRLGVYFSGCPPRIDGIHQDSPLIGKVKEGQYAYSLVFPGVLEVSDIHGTKSFVKLLSQYDDQQRRILVVSDEPSILTGHVQFKLYLPPGTIGMALDDVYPPVVCHVDPESPVANIIEVGMTLNRAYVPGVPMMEGDSTSHMAFAEALMKHHSTPGRILWLSKPAPLQPPGSPSRGPAIPTGVARSTAGGTSPLTLSPTSPLAVAAGGPTATVTSNNNNGPAIGNAIQATTSMQGPASQAPPDLQLPGLGIEIQGQGSQSITLSLSMGQSVLANPQALIYMTENVEVSEPTHTGGSRWTKNKSGNDNDDNHNSLATFRCTDLAGGDICFAGNGSILTVPLQQYGGALTCQRNAFLCADDKVRIGVEFAANPSFAPDGGLILQGMAGDGLVALLIKGSVLQKKLKVGEILRVQTAALVAFENGVKQQSDHTDGTGVMSTVMGPGMVWMQSAPHAM